MKQPLWIGHCGLGARGCLGFLLGEKNEGKEPFYAHQKGHIGDPLPALLDNPPPVRLHLPNSWQYLLDPSLDLIRHSSW